MAPIGQIISVDIQNNNPLLYGYLIDDPKLLISYPCYSYGDDFYEYIPESRPWFKLAESMMENPIRDYKVSAPYLCNIYLKVVTQT